MTAIKSELKEDRQGSTKGPVNCCHSISLRSSGTTAFTHPNTSNTTGHRKIFLSSAPAVRPHGVNVLQHWWGEEGEVPTF